MKPRPAVRSISASEAWAAVQRGEAQIRDLRTELERRRYGWPPDAPRVSLARHVLRPEGPDTIYLCQHANRSKLTGRRGAVARLWSVLGPLAADSAERREVLAGLHGHVLDLGAGSGVNFRHYPRTVERVTAVEPEPYLRRQAVQEAARVPIEINVVAGTADEVPLSDSSCDAAVTTLVLCTVPDQRAALSELRRVLRPGGELRFYEHVVAHHRVPAGAQRWLDRSGVWPKIGAGCHMSRETLEAIRAAGFSVDGHRRFVSGVGPFSLPHVAGVAIADK